MRKRKEILSYRNGPICTLVINRPEKRNLLTPDCLLEMADIIEGSARTDEIRALVIRGAGNRAFSAGYDIPALPTNPSADMEEALKETPPLEKALLAIQTFPYPVIAMINGYAYGGGCELAVACDIRIATRHAKMGMPAAKLGLVYPYAGYRRFMRVLGFNRTLEIFLTGRQYDCETCLRIGLVNYVVEDRELESFTYTMAGEIAENAPLALRGSKFALYKISDYAIAKETEDQLHALFFQSLRSEDLQEGKRAFMAKRKPVFQGR